MPRVRELTTNRRIIDVRKQLTSKCRQIMFDNNIKLEAVLAVLYLTGADGEITRTMNKVRL